MNKQPQITAATKNKIMISFWELYKENRIDKITVHAITASAGVHRSTFYKYFIDIYDLLEQFEDDLIRDLTADVIQFLKVHPAVDLNIFAAEAPGIMIKYAQQIYYLTGVNGDASFRKKILGAVTPLFLRVNHIPKDYPYLDYLMTIIFSVMFVNINYWYEHQDTITLKEVADLAKKLMGTGLQEVRKDMI